MPRIRAPFPLFLPVAFFALGCTVPVAAGLDDVDANRILVTLDQSGIDAAKEVDQTAEGKFRVTVARDDVGRALAVLREEELPRPKARGILDGADRGQLVPSQAREHAELVAAMAGELEKTLSGIDGVLSARVHLNLPAREPFRDTAPAKGTASVLVEHRGTTPPLAPESIQRLVAGGAPGVVPADVAVVFVPRAMRGGGGRTDLAHVGPITVARGSMNTLKIAFASMAVVLLALAATTLALWSKITRLRREQLELGSARPGQPGQSARSIHPAMSGPRP